MAEGPVVFRLDADAEIGLGHLKRGLSLAQALAESGIASHFLVHDDPAARTCFSRSPHSVEWLASRVAEEDDLGRTLEAMRALRGGGDVVLIDSYAAHDGYVAAMRDDGFKVVYCDDGRRAAWDVDAIVNGSAGAEAVPYRAPVALLGPPYLMLPPEYWETGPATRRGPDVRDVLVTMGGIDHYDLSSRILDALSLRPDPPRTHVVVGPYYDNAERIGRAAGRYPGGVELYRSPDSLLPIARLCDAAISAGGTTLYELARLGVATVGIALWENQRPNVDELGAAGVVEPLIYTAGERFDTALAEAFERLRGDEPRRSVMIARGCDLVDGQGARRVARAIRGLMGDDARASSGSRDRTGACAPTAPK